VTESHWSTVANLSHATAVTGEMAPRTVSEPYPSLSEAEAKVLALYDQLQQLQLELALFRSQQSHRASGQASP
jgi:hypothetical protein